MKALAPYAKALAAALVAALAFATPVVDDGLVWSEVLGIVAAFLTAAGVVWRVPWSPAVPDVLPEPS